MKNAAFVPGAFQIPDNPPYPNLVMLLWIRAEPCTLVDGKGYIQSRGGGNIVKETNNLAI